MMQTMICFRFGLLAVIGAVLSACASDSGTYRPLSPAVAPSPASFTHRAASPDVELLWNCSQAQPETMKLTGAARNIGQRDVQSIMLRARSWRLGDTPMLLTEEALPEIILYWRNRYVPGDAQPQSTELGQTPNGPQRRGCLRTDSLSERHSSVVDRSRLTDPPDRAIDGSVAPSVPPAPKRDAGKPPAGQGPP
jgi:hypothetical protein